MEIFDLLERESIQSNYYIWDTYIYMYDGQKIEGFAFYAITMVFYITGGSSGCVVCIEDTFNTNKNRKYSKQYWMHAQKTIS